MRTALASMATGPRKNGNPPIPLQRWETWGTDGLWLPVLSRTGGMGSLLLVGKQVSQRAALNIAVGAASMLLAVAAKHSPNDKRRTVSSPELVSPVLFEPAADEGAYPDSFIYAFLRS